MDDKNDITVITADFMYLVILGEHQKICEIVNILNKTDKEYRYISTEIDDPCVKLNNDIIKKLFKNNPFNTSTDSDDSLPDKYIDFCEGVEQAQSLTFAEGYNKNYHIIFETEKKTNNILIRYPKLCLEEETEPEKLIGSWIKKNNLSCTMDKLVIRPVNIVGSKNEILVFAAKVLTNDKK